MSLSVIRLEAITWIPDAFLVANSFFDEAAGHLYNPSEYANHGSGLFFVGLEANGVIYAYALDHVLANGFRRIATIASGNSTAICGLGWTKPSLTRGFINCTNAPPANASTVMPTVAAVRNGQ